MALPNAQVLPPFKASPLGDTLDFFLAFQENDGSPTNLAGVNFEIGLVSPDGAMSVRKGTSAYVVTNAGGGLAVATFQPTDTASLKAQTYDLDFVLIDATGKRTSWLSKIPLLAHPNLT